MKRVLITGANRGLGLELARQSLERGDRVIATCRRPAEAQELQQWRMRYGDQLLVVALDVTEDASVRAARAEAGRHLDRLDVLINNAAILVRDETLANFDSAIMQRTFDTNVTGAMRVSKHFLDLLRRGSDPKLINITSQLGSLQKMRANWGQYSYNSSKAALNMVTRMLAFDLEPEGIAVQAIHPGWVQSDMGGAHAAVPAQDSAAGVLRLIDDLSLSNSGMFYVYTGEVHPW
jgi:NAD(P)-dependent dehydrogenase (short-subunit alcohol dehydrogenase family)